MSNIEAQSDKIAPAPPEAGTTNIGTSEPESETPMEDKRCCCRRSIMDGNTQALAFLLNAMATAIVFSGSGAFLIPAVIKLAKLEVGCEVEAPPGETKVEECHEKIYGLKPSSMIAAYSSALFLAGAMTMPLVGAIVDTTSYRRGMGRAMSVAFLAFLLGTGFLEESNWFGITLSFTAMGFVGLFQSMVLYSYLPEITDDEAKLIRYTRTFSMGQFGGMVLFLAIVVGLSSGLYERDKTTLDDEIHTARLSQSIIFGVGFVLLGVAWGCLFEKRQPARILQDGESAWSGGCHQLYNTAIKVHRHYPTLQWFFIGIALGDAATSALLVMGITFLAEVLEFSGAQNGTAIVIMMISCIPGGILSSWWSRRFNPVSSTIAALVVLFVNTTLVATILNGPHQEIEAYILAVPWGVGQGWKVTVDRLLYARILPAGQNAEFSGTFVFFRQSLTWLPPLVFTLINESSEIPLQWGLGSVNIFILLCIAVYVFGIGVGRYAEAVSAAERNVAQEDNDITEGISDPDKYPIEDASFHDLQTT